MADGLSGIGAAPFNVQSDIHQQTQSRERIETHLSEQRVEKEHRANHSHLEALAKQIWIYRKVMIGLVARQQRIGRKGTNLKHRGVTWLIPLKRFSNIGLCRVL